MKNSIWLSILFVVACGGKSAGPEPTPTPTPTEKECVKSGCSGTVCSDEEGLMTTCEWRPEYACYQEAECTRQPDGNCGWTETEVLTACLASPPVE